MYFVKLVSLCFAILQIVVCHYDPDDIFRCGAETGNCSDNTALFGIKKSECNTNEEKVDESKGEGNFKIRCCYFATNNTHLNYNWYVDGHQVDNDENMKDVLKFTKDSLGAYISFPKAEVIGEKLRKTYLNFTCKASTDEGYVTHTTMLTTKFICISVDAKSEIFVHPVPTQALEGETVEFNCTTFSKLDDFIIEWQFNNKSKVNENISKYEIITSSNSSCTNVTSILKIKNLSLDDFDDEFTCVLILNRRDLSIIKSKPAKLMMSITEIIENKIYAPGIIISLSLLILALLMAIVAYVLRIELLLFIKDKFAKLETDGLYDLFICYNSDDSEKFVANFILPNLEKDYGYKCFVLERNTNGGDWIPEIISSKIKESKRFLLIMSKSVATDPLCIYACEVAVEHAIRGQTLKQLISIYPRDKKKELFNDMAHVESLKLMCSSSKRVPRVDPQERDEKKLARFWDTVRLHLPPIRDTHIEEAAQPLKETFSCIAQQC